jgi:O-antigen/teichoic acid export membrane protein
MSTVEAATDAPTAAPPVRRGSMGRQSLTYAGGLLFSRLLAFLMLPVYTNFLTPVDYGTLQLLMLTLDVLAVAAGARIAGGIFYFHANAESDEARRDLVATTLLLLGATYGAIGLLVSAGAAPLSELIFGGPHRTHLLRYAGAAFAFDGLLLVGLTVLQVRGRATAFVLLTVGRQVLQVLLNLVMLVSLGRGIEGMMFATLVANALFGGLLAWWLLAGTGLRFERPLARRLVRFGIPLVGTQVATMVAAYGDRYVLGVEAGLDAVGIYGLAMQFGTLVFTLGFAPFNQMWEPRRFEVIRAAGGDAANARAFRHCNLIILTLGLAISLFVRDYLRLASPPAFHAAASVVPLLVVAYVLMAWSDFQNVGIMLSERTGLIAVANWVCAAVAWAGYLWAIPRWGVFGAAGAAVAAYGARQLLQYRFSQRLRPLQYDWTPIVRQAAYAGIVWAIGSQLPLEAVRFAIPAHVGLFGLYLAAVWYGGVMTADDRTLVRQVAARARRTVVGAARGWP